MTSWNPKVSVTLFSTNKSCTSRHAIPCEGKHTSPRALRLKFSPAHWWMRSMGHELATKQSQHKEDEYVLGCVYGRFYVDHDAAWIRSA